MNREIKFRVWNNTSKSWVNLYPGIPLVFLNKNGEFIFSDLSYKPKRWTVEQFTGLKDRNGVEIYEGDILENVESGKQIIADGHWESDDFERGVVEWHDELARFGLSFYSKYGGEGYTGREQHIDVCVKNSGVVIGNIHENSNLIP